LLQHSDPAREALEAYAIAGYRSGALTPRQTRELLGIATRYEFDGFLKDHDVWEHAYTVEDLKQDMLTLDRWQLPQVQRSSE
jgi:predicted HTH domain antitoxin